jgi:rhamnose transport system ATP-binding protein
VDAGERRLNGVPVQIRSPRDAIRLGLAYVPEDRRQHGVVAPMSIEANASMANLGAVSRLGIIDRAAERQAAGDYVSRLRVKAPSTGVPVDSLSGGNQQKVALARWLFTRPSVLLLDEPTQGVDVGSKAEIHEIIMSLAERGAAIVMISSELPEILGMSDRVAVMRNGTIAGVLAGEQATQARILDLALGHGTYGT